ncbi:MAG: hypothetical protein ACKOET_02505 [Verrucomicrobiota bacterium]
MRGVPAFVRCLSWWGRALSCLGPLASAWGQADFQGATHLVDLEEGTLRYSKEAATGPIARLQARLASGATVLRHDERFGYLPSLLESLGVPRSSQMLVFSKTSLQREHIRPANPRSVFYADDVYVGFIPGAPVLEISEVDPKLGGVFYTLEQARTETPRLVRVDNCLECHASARSLGVPGHLVRSFETDRTGVIDLLSGAESVNHRTPLADRWGGWYVSGTHGAQTHRGNLMGKEAYARQAKEPNFAANRPTLEGFFDESRYYGRGSDIVALMVFEHQAHLHNLITRLHYMARQQLAAYGHVNYLKAPVEAFLRYALFVEETPLTAPLKGDPAFGRDFMARGPRDARGRSLRDLDLQTRLFRHPCSFLLYSEAFAALPDPLKERIHRRLWEILRGEDTSEAYARLDAPGRRALYEILRDTLPGLPAYWHAQDGRSGADR